MAQSPRFENTGGGAAVGNPNITRQGQTAGATQVSNAGAGRGFVNPPRDGPPNVTAAPKGNSAQNTFTGLCEALNAFQRDLVKKGTYEIADVYEIKFAPASMGNAELKKPGTIDQGKTPMQQAKTAKSTLDPATNTVMVRGLTISVAQGTQIIQFIDQVIRGSTYIGNQQLYQMDEETQDPIKNPAAGNRPTAWYKITVKTQSLGVDKKRNDQAYKMTFYISPYGINETRSEYFPKTSFRGVHKSYQYWFTGKNLAVLNYEQKLNNLYFQTVSETLPLQRTAETNSKMLYKRSWQTRSDQSDQQASGNTNEPAANLADFLYTQNDFATSNLRIVGDPAWLQQGEVSGGINEQSFNFSAFNADGGINFEAQEVVYDVTFNQPEDYNFSTGLMEVNGNYKKPDGTSGRNYPAQTQTYKAVTCKSIFSRGRFEQELHGTLLTDIFKTELTTQSARPLSSLNDVVNGIFGLGTRSLSNKSANNPWMSGSGDGITKPNSDVLASEYPTEQDGTTTPVAEAEPGDPTSNGDIVVAGNNDPYEDAGVNIDSQLMDREA